MKKSGLTKPYGVSSVDLSLLVIGIFCGGLLIFVGFLFCCRRKPAGKKKSLWRKRRKTKNTEENTLLKGEGSSTNNEDTSPSVSLSRKHREVSPSSSEHSTSSNGVSHAGKHSILQLIKWNRKEEDIECGENFQTPKKNTKKGNKKAKVKLQKSVEKQHNNMSTEKSNEVTMEDLSKNNEFSREKNEEDMDVASVEPKKSCNKQSDTGEKATKRPLDSYCQGGDCKKCKPYSSRVTDVTVRYVARQEQVIVEKNKNKTEDYIVESIPGKSEPKTLKEDVVENDNAAPVDKYINKTLSQEKALSSKAKASRMAFDDKKAEIKLSGTDVEVFQTNDSIGDALDIQEYAFLEWKGDTKKAETIRMGYNDVNKELGFHKLRVIRGDNYCGIRATLFQALVQNIPILSRFKAGIEKIPYDLQSQGCSWIDEWTFGQRIKVENRKIYEKMCECLKDLDNLVTLIKKMNSTEGRESHLLASLNFKQDYEIKLLEAVKLLMLATAVNLHNLQNSGQDVPVFAIIMFARDTSTTPRQLMNNHLNTVGQTGGLEQVEMHLLGYSLGTTIRVVRPSHFGQSDFIACYPDNMPDGTPLVTLVAEDDRHYNVLI